MLEEILDIHSEHTGMLSIKSEFEIKDKSDLAKAYTPHVAKLCEFIAKDESRLKKYTMSGKLISVITDGSAVLGLGNIGPSAGLPIAEGKALIYKDLSGVNAMPMCIEQVDVDEMVSSIKNISKNFSGIHLEDIKAPECFEIEKKLIEELDIPVYHDDQHGTAIAVLAALMNSSKIVDKKLEDMKIVINGAGASGIATANLLLSAGIKNIILVDLNGVLDTNDNTLNYYQKEIALNTNPNSEKGSLNEVIKNKDVFIGLSVADVLNEDMVKSMNKDAIVFALSNPNPEINPEIAHKAGAKIVATGGSNYPNQINNILVFPGMFKGLLRSGLCKIDDNLKITIASSLANLVDDIAHDKIIPGVFDDGVVDAVCETVINYSNSETI